MAFDGIGPTAGSDQDRIAGADKAVTQNAVHRHLAYQLARAHRKLNADLEAMLQQDGMSVEQWRVLDLLGDGAGRPMGELARLVLMNHPALTKLADRMVANGLVHRIADPEDQRRVLLHITDRGRVLSDRLRRRAEDHNRTIEVAFGTAKTAALMALLDDLVEDPPAAAPQTGGERLSQR